MIRAGAKTIEGTAGGGRLRYSALLTRGGTSVKKLIVLVAVLAALAGSNARAVINGTEADEGEYPWAAAVYKQSPNGFLQPVTGQYCGGSLVAPRLVVTAAHCYFGVIDDIPAALPADPLALGVHVMLGENSLNGTGERIRVISIDAHPDADMDLAALTLARESTYTPITPATPDDADLFEPGTMATVVGWGATSESGSYPTELMEAEVPIVDDASCGEAYSDPGYGWAADAMICAGYPHGGTDTCYGDSGGPLAVPAPTPSGWLLVGATSFGEGCARAGYPGVYAEIPAASAFIGSHS